MPKKLVRNSGRGKVVGICANLRDESTSNLQSCFWLANHGPHRGRGQDCGLGGDVAWQYLNGAVIAKTGSASAKTVLLILANRAHEKTGVCFPSISTICSESELSRPTVIKAIRTLEAGGFIRVVRKHRRSSDYVINRRLFNESGKPALPSKATLHGGKKERSKLVKPLYSNHQEPPINQTGEKSPSQESDPDRNLTAQERIERLRNLRESI